MKFIQRGSYIAYTIPVAGFDVDYFNRNGLEHSIYGGYVAKEFNSADHVELLTYADFAETENTLPVNLKKMIIEDAVEGSGQVTEEGSYVNTDFPVTYQVFFNRTSGKPVIDVGGLPLRYFWDIAEDGSAVIQDVEVFKFPEKEFDLQDRAVMFFQTAAILRQFSQDNQPEFNRFMGEVSAAIRGEETKRSPRRR